MWGVPHDQRGVMEDSLPLKEPSSELITIGIAPRATAMPPAAGTGLLALGVEQIKQPGAQEQVDPIS